MNKKSLWTGALSGLVTGLTLAWAVDYWKTPSSEINNFQKTSRSPDNFKKIKSSDTKFDKNKSLLSQTGNQLDTLIQYYSQMTSEELHSEITKIDSEYKSNPTGTLSDSIAILYLAYCWGMQDAESAYQYSSSKYLSNNMAMNASSWTMLVIQAWAERDPERAYLFSCQRHMDEMIKNSTDDTTSDLSNIDWNNSDLPTTVHQQYQEELAPHLDVFNFGGATTRIEYAFAKFFPNEALRWSKALQKEEKKFSIPYDILVSLAWNHPEKLFSLGENCPGTSDMYELYPSTQWEIARIFKNTDLRNMEKWIQNFSQEDQKYIKNKLEYEENLGNVDTAFKYFEELPEERKRDARFDIIYLLKDKEPEKLMNWLRTTYTDDILSDKDQMNELGTLFSVLYPENRNSVFRYKTYLEQLPPSLFRQTISNYTVSFLSHLGYGFEDILSLTKIARNQNSVDYETIDISLNIWSKYNDKYDQIENWLKTSDLTPEQKIQLRKKYQFPSHSQN